MNEKVELKVTVYVEIPFETCVEVDTSLSQGDQEKEAIAEALNREPYIPYPGEGTNQSYWVVGDILEFPNLGKNETPDVEEA